jgi:cystathionine beta-synthase
MLKVVKSLSTRVPRTAVVARCASSRDWRTPTPVPPYAGWDKQIEDDFWARAAPDASKQPMKNNRAGICDSVLDLVGQTPMVRMPRLAKELGIDPSIDVCAKLEYFNAGGSVKDRVGLRMVEEAEKDGRLKPGDVILEPTSGNTGIGLCLAAALKGYKVVIAMPVKMSGEKLNTMKSLGADILRTPNEAGWDDELSHISLCAELAETSPNAHVLDQYLNSGNPLSHYDGTGTEILQQTGGDVDVIIIGAGTGGTFTGIAKKIKEGAPNCKIIAVDPVGSILAVPDSLNDYKRMEGYEVEGIGYDFVPTVMDKGLVDEWMKIGDEEGFKMARKMIKHEGMMVGGSSGYAMAAAHTYIKQHEEELKGKRVVIICPDSIRNYMSKYLDDAWMDKFDFETCTGKDEPHSAPLRKVACEKRLSELENAKKDNKVSEEDYNIEKEAILKRLGEN